MPDVNQSFDMHRMFEAALVQLYAAMGQPAKARRFARRTS